MASLPLSPPTTRPMPPRRRRGADGCAFGIVGLETALSVATGGAGRERPDDLPTALATMTATPARLLGLPGRAHRRGPPADLLVFDPKARRIIDPERFESLGRNTLRRVRNCPVSGAVIIGGHAVTALDCSLRRGRMI